MFYNKWLGIGNVGQDPEVRTFDNGSKIATFSLATSKFYKPKGSDEYKTITQWHKIVVKNKNLIEYILEKGYIKKGSQICVEGELETREFNDKDGKLIKITEIVVNIGHDIKINYPKDKKQEEFIDDSIPF